jgi:hypothetical protein
LLPVAEAVQMSDQAIMGFGNHAASALGTSALSGLKSLEEYFKQLSLQAANDASAGPSASDLAQSWVNGQMVNGMLQSIRPRDPALVAAATAPALSYEQARAPGIIERVRSLWGLRR